MEGRRSGTDRLAQLLREVRGDRRQVDAAAVSGWTQSAVSRGEHGTFTPSEGQAEQYARALGARPAQRRELLGLCRDAAAHQVSGQARLVRSGAEIQRRIGVLERQSRLVRGWQPELVPGLLQTWDYTLAVVGPDPGERWIERRRERVARLDDPRRQTHMLVSEAVLRWVIGSPEVMAAQREHLIELSRRDNVTIGVLPFGPVLPPAPPSFDLYADRTVIVETHTGVQFLDDRAEVAAYQAEFDRLAAHAVTGDDAADLIAACG